MDYGKSFSFVFDDEEWIQKLLIGGILALIPVVNLVVFGYGLQVLKNAALGEGKALPNWDDFADYFMKGLLSILGAFVWALPIILLSMIGALFSVPVDRMTGYGTSPDWTWGWANLCFALLSCLSALYGLFMAFVMPAAMTQYAVSGEFAAFFRFNELYKYIASNLGPYIVVLLLGAVAWFIAGFGVVVCFVGVAFTSFWASLVGNHLLGQVYRASEATGA